MGSTSEVFEAVLAGRRARRPLIEAEVERWERVRSRLVELEHAVTDLPAGGGGGALDLPFPDMHRAVTQAATALTSARSRVCRTTVNIGVGGAARNGKSTLLQSFTGLGDDQIPTGEGLPVTAVRSRIFHAPGPGRAVLTLHTERSFLDEVVAPFHVALQLGPEPRSMEEFCTRRYPASEEELNDAVRLDSGQSNPMRQRLTEMQESVDSYRRLLRGEIREMSLEGLRPWVAYPEQVPGGPRPDRRYLAVRDARIECSFPRTEVTALACLDLPGLGEIMPNAEEHHLNGLENEVDVALLIKRPLGNTAYWGSQDGNALSLISRARGPVNARDFAIIVINTGLCDQRNIDAVRAHILANVNEGVDGRRHRVIVADVKDPGVAREMILQPVLEHLTDRLAAMDQAVLDDSFRQCEAANRQILPPVLRAIDILRRITTPTSTEELLRRARQLRVDVTRELQRVVGDLAAEAAGTSEDAEYLAEVERAHQAVREWIVSGFGEGEEVWCARALDSMALDAASAPFAVDELNRIRIEMGRRFGAIDAFLTRKRDEFWNRIGTALSTRLVRSGPEVSARERLERLCTLFLDAPDQCPALASAVEQVLDVRLDYRTRVFPQMVRAFDLLRAEAGDPHAREPRPILTVPRDPAGARELYAHIQRLARQAAHDAKVALMEESGTSAVVLLAYAQQFEDTLIRSAESEAEFRRIAEAYRDELWPGEFTRDGVANAPVQRLRHQLRALREQLASEPVILPDRELTRV